MGQLAAGAQEEGAGPGGKRRFVAAVRFHGNFFPPEKYPVNPLDFRAPYEVWGQIGVMQTG